MNNVPRGHDDEVSDERLYEALLEADFEGPLWGMVETRCAAYALTTFLPNVVSGKVWTQGRQKGLRGFGKESITVDVETANSITDEVITRALVEFRSVLRSGRWNPDRGTKLTSWFYGQCLFQLPNVYRNHMNRNDRHMVPLDDVLETAMEHHYTNTEQWVGIGQEVDHRLGKITSDQVKSMFVLRAAGFSNREIAERLGVSLRTVENAMLRHRQSRHEW